MTVMVDIEVRSVECASVQWTGVRTSSPGALCVSITLSLPSRHSDTIFPLSLSRSGGFSSRKSSVCFSLSPIASVCEMCGVCVVYVARVKVASINR